MAMLAEPRRRQRIGPNPRGKFFLAQEDNKGKNLLQRLGWNEGDGLGLQKQGISAPIRPKIQMNSNGLGYDIKEDPWVEHSRDFESILSNLQVVHGESAEATTDANKDTRLELESQSKGSRARIHYHKFTRGKDLSRIKSEDWASIFGNSIETPKPSSTVSSVEIKPEPELEDTTEDLKTVNMGSMTDYFKNKMKALQERKQGTTTDENSSVEINVEPDSFPSGTIDDEDGTVCIPQTEEPTKKKRKKNKEPVLPDEEIIETPVIEKRKKKRKGETLESTVSNVEIETDPQPQDTEDTTKDGLKYINMGSMTDYFNSKMKALQERKHATTDDSNSVEIKMEPDSLPNPVIDDDVNIPQTDEPTKKKQKKNKEPPLSLPNEEIETPVIEKRKKKREKTILPIPDEGIEPPVQEKRKKKCKGEILEADINPEDEESTKTNGETVQIPQTEEESSKSEAWDNKKHRYLTPKQVSRLQKQFNGSNLSKVKGYGMF